MLTSRLKPLVRIVDNDEMVLRSESFLARMNGWEVAEYTSPLEFLSKDDFQRPGCAVLDIRMPEMSGIELYEELKQRGIDLSVIFLTGHGDIDMAVRSMKDGAIDFLVKPAEDERFNEAVAKAVSINVEKRRQREELERNLALYDTLSDREKTVAAKVAKGLQNKIIADELDISENSVKKYRATLQEKLGYKNIVELSDFLRSIDKADTDE